MTSATRREVIRMAAAMLPAIACGADIPSPEAPLRRSFPRMESSYCWPPASPRRAQSRASCALAPSYRKSARIFADKQQGQRSSGLY